MSRDIATDDNRLKSHLNRLAKEWSKGKISLKQIVGLTEQELYAIACQGYTFFLQGKNQQALVIFEGLIAVDPRNAYAYQALGSIYWRNSEPHKAIKQFTYAIRVNPSAISTYISRAEIYVSLNQFMKARQDLMHVLQHATTPDHQVLINKAKAILTMIK